MRRSSLILMSLPGLLLAYLAYDRGYSAVAIGLLIGLLAVWFFNERIRAR